MDSSTSGGSYHTQPKWRKVAYGGMQPGFDDNHTDESFLEDIVMNANVVKRDILKVMLDSVSISEYLCIVTLVGLVWTYTLRSTLDENSLLFLDIGLLGSTVRAPGDVKNPSLTSCISLNASIVASVLIASRLPSRSHVFAIMLFSLQVFLFAPLVIYSIKKYSLHLHLLFSFCLVTVTLVYVYFLHQLFFILLASLLIFVTIVCPYWLIRIQEFKFEINGPWDEAKLCFDIRD
ncbi:hypothetical protein IC582_028825 [Cucumis melo]